MPQKSTTAFGDGVSTRDAPAPAVKTSPAPAQPQSPSPPKKPLPRLHRLLVTAIGRYGAASIIIGGTILCSVVSGAIA